MLNQNDKEHITAKTESIQNSQYGDNQQKQSRVIVCIPAYNEEKTIDRVIESAKKFTKEILVYDDGSKDNTSAKAKSKGATVIRNSVNRGYGKAISTLLRNAFNMGADIVITLDSDGQHDADQIPSLIDPIKNDEADIVIGSRFLNATDTKKIPSYRRFGINAITRLTKVACNNNITDAQSGFRAYNKEALSKLYLVETGMQISTEILIRASEAGLRIAEVPATITYDVENGSTHNPLSQGLTTIHHVIQFLSLKHPLLFYGLPGLALLLCSGIFIYNALELFSSTRYISTNSILVSIGFALAGMVLLATGAIVYTMIAILKGRIR